MSERRPLLIFDGDCGFCRYWVLRLQAVVGDRISVAPSQEVAERFPDVSSEEFGRSVVFVERDGSKRFGADAGVHALSQGRWLGWLRTAWRVPGVAPTAEVAYRFVADHRMAFSRITRLLWGRVDSVPGFSIAPWVFLRLLALVYLVAFASLWTQVDGLIGSDGILPLERFMDALGERAGDEGWTRWPTLFWLNASDFALHAACASGVVLSLLLFVGYAPVPILACAWGVYLSLTIAGQRFFEFQWDLLLLETGLLAIFLAPLTLRPRRPGPAPLIARWLLWFLLFRLMTLSGAVKIASGDASWIHLTALDVHYQTQPLPNWLAWHVHQMPHWFHRISVRANFVAELWLPFLILAPRRLRHLAALGMAGFIGVIAATGNYGFFHLLTLALIVLLVDDAAWPRRVRDLPSPREGAREVRQWPAALLVPIAALSLTLTTHQMVRRLGGNLELPKPVQSLADAARPFRSFNSYGLFAVMTTRRNEIVFEGSVDGVTWLPYEFRYKPGDPERRPPLIGPHMPRLDWQMWFAAFGNWNRKPWFYEFAGALLDDAPEVKALLAHDPFPEGPPKHLRVAYYEYSFTDRETRRREGRWWDRQLVDHYGPFRRRR